MHHYNGDALIEKNPKAFVDGVMNGFHYILNPFGLFYYYFNNNFSTTTTTTFSTTTIAVVEVVVFFLFDLILYVPSTIFQLYRDGSSWVEPVLS